MKRMADGLASQKFDLLVLGGGITGAGVALDATLRGFRVALIDKGDFASGTSSVSSKLVHGGLRYLEHGDFRLVYEALHERGRLLHNAPHLVRPLQFIIPFYEGARVPAWKWRVGLTLYDLLAGRSNIRRSRPLTRPKMERSYAGLKLQGLTGGAAYCDAQMDDARLCIEVLKSAAEKGACLANYVEAVAFETTGAEIRGVRALDRISGREFTIRARQVLNATGPWVDQTCRLAGDTAPPLLRPTKGAHLIVPNPGLDAAFLFLHPADGRVFFVIPWLEGAPELRKTKLLIGTTDTRTEEAPGALTVTAEDRSYLLAGYNHYFSPALGDGEILGTFAGLRPLIRSRADHPSAQSREFLVQASANGLLSVAGGKYTTYRRMAEVIVDRVAKRLGRRRRCRTHAYLLDGAPEEPWESYEHQESARVERRFRLSSEAARHLVSRYGRRAQDVAASLETDSSWQAPIVAGEPDLRVEHVYQREHEMAVFPEDCLLRRTRLGLIHPELGIQREGSCPATPRFA